MYIYIYIYNTYTHIYTYTHIHTHICTPSNFVSAQWAARPHPHSLLRGRCCKGSRHSKGVNSFVFVSCLFAGSDTRCAVLHNKVLPKGETENKSSTQTSNDASCSLPKQGFLSRAQAKREQGRDRESRGEIDR